MDHVQLRKPFALKVMLSVLSLFIPHDFLLSSIMWWSSFAFVCKHYNIIYLYLPLKVIHIFILNSLLLKRYTVRQLMVQVLQYTELARLPAAATVRQTFNANLTQRDFPFNLNMLVQNSRSQIRIFIRNQCRRLARTQAFDFS